MARTKSSKRWLKEHFDDEFVHRARKDGFRSRAVYKLQELDHKYRIFRPGMTVIDLGAAPGAWSQYAAAAVKEKGRVVALDLLPMDPIDGVECLQGDFRDDEILAQLVNIVGSEEIDLVMSDMAPNISGMQAIDQPRAMYLAELAVDFAGRMLRPGGAMLAKVFQGEGFDALLRDLRPDYARVIARKPQASRGRSREVYLLATGRKL